MFKVKIICELPPNALFGSRPETHFIRFPDSFRIVLNQVMIENNLPDLEATVLFMLRRGLEIFNEEQKEKEQEQSRAQGNSESLDQLPIE